MSGDFTAILRKADNAIATHPQGMLMTASVREAQEVQGAIMSSRQFPRIEQNSFNKIISACQRPKLANEAMYAYKRGSEMVTGPSIRLAETLAQCWGNLQSGVRQLSKNENESIMQAYCWDLETNYKQERIFTVAHFRETKSGGYKLTSERDIYEVTANMGARRLRACILATIPSDVVEAAIEECEKTISGAGKVAERIGQIVMAFKQFDVSEDDLNRYLGHSIKNASASDVVKLTKIGKSIKDGITTKEDWFGTPDIAPEAKAAAVVNAAPSKAVDHAVASHIAEMQKAILDELKTVPEEHLKTFTVSADEISKMTDSKQLEAILNAVIDLKN